MAGKAQMILHAIEAGQGEPLALLHGLFGSARNFGTVQREFARQHRTIALDLRNHGASPHAADMDYAALAGDVLQTLDRLHALPATLLGHSMGGKVAMFAALTQPDRIARLIVADIAPVVYAPHYRDIAAAMMALSLPSSLTRADADAALAASVPDTTMRAFLLQNLQTGASPAWRIGMAGIAAALPAIEDWHAPSEARYDGPTLFIAGATSNYIQPAHRAVIRTLFPQARFVTLKHAGHWLHADNPSGFVAVVEAFLTATA
jgi:esterase